MTVADNTSMTKLTHPHTFSCDVPECNYSTSHKTLEEAYSAQEAHSRDGSCPMAGKRSYLLEETDDRGQAYSAPHLSKSIAEKLWDELDREFGILSGEPTGDGQSLDWRKGKLRGLATSIQLMQSLYYETVDQVVAQVVQRRKMKLGAIEFQPTPGYAFNPPPPGSKAYEKSMKRIGTEESTKPTKAPTKATHRKAAKKAEPKIILSGEEQAKIKKALDTGLFDDSDLALTFGVSESYIKGLREKA